MHSLGQSTRVGSAQHGAPIIQSRWLRRRSTRQSGRPVIRQELSAKSGDALRRARNDTGVSASHLRLRPVTEADEDVVLHAHEVLIGDGFNWVRLPWREPPEPRSER